LRALAQYHGKNPLHMMAPRRVVETPGFAPTLLQHVEDALLATGEIRRQDGMLALKDHEPLALLSDPQRKTMAEIEDTYRRAGLAPPAPKDQPQEGARADLLQLLIDRGSLIALRNVALKQVLVFHVLAVNEAAKALRASFPEPAEFTTSEARTALGTSRRVIVPLLEHLDATGVSLRRGDMRRMAAANSVSPDAPPC
jgi:selenocysteine-specific elongation factor